jgi:hypothetical protein
MDPRVHAKLLQKIEPMPSRPICGKLYVRKSDRVIVKTTNRSYQPACTLCLEEMVELEYGELCERVKMKQYSNGLQQGRNFYVCFKHQKSNDERLRHAHKISATEVSTAKPIKQLYNKSYKCILCPGDVANRKRGQSSLNGLLCHKCYLCALEIPNCPEWIRNIRRSKCCPSCGESRARTKAGDTCFQCKQNDEYEPDEALLEEIRKVAKSTFL